MPAEKAISCHQTPFIETRPRLPSTNLCNITTLVSKCTFKEQLSVRSKAKSVGKAVADERIVRKRAEEMSKATLDQAEQSVLGCCYLRPELHYVSQSKLFASYTIQTSPPQICHMAEDFHSGLCDLVAGLCLHSLLFLLVDRSNTVPALF